MWNLIQHVTTSWMDETVRLCEGFRRGESDPFPTWEDPPAITPFDSVAQYGKLRLRYYPAQGTPQPTPSNSRLPLQVRKMGVGAPEFLRFAML
jgi:hypothetical protein